MSKVHISGIPKDEIEGTIREYWVEVSDTQWTTYDQVQYIVRGNMLVISSATEAFTIGPGEVHTVSGANIAFATIRFIP